MARTRTPGEPDEEPTESLTGAVTDLADQVRVLREAIDELRSAIRWGSKTTSSVARRIHRHRRKWSRPKSTKSKSSPQSVTHALKSVAKSPMLSVKDCVRR